MSGWRSSRWRSTLPNWFVSQWALPEVWQRPARLILRTAALSIGAMFLISTAGFEIAQRHLGPPPLDSIKPDSVVVSARDGKLLRAFTTSDGRWRLPATTKEVDPKYLLLLKTYEDRRFADHRGVDLWAILRAAGQLVANGRIVSGASTLTMQVARLVEGVHDRTARGKFRQIVRALQLEQRLSKSEILDLYLRLAPFGGNLEGVRAASLAYFGKEPRRLSMGEAALLVALPQSPEWRRPDRNQLRAREARGRVLDRAVWAGVISKAEADYAKGELVPDLRKAFPKLAPHLAEQLVREQPDAATHATTIDAPLQNAIERAALDHARRHGKNISAAVLVAEHANGAIRAWVGSADYFDHRRFGPIDMTTAVRSPGSTLKPFIYGLAFENGLAHPSMLIEDRPVRFGSYAPENFDEAFRGTVTVREALQHSLNVPAVKLLNSVGPTRLAARVREAGVDFRFPAREAPSLALALGGVGTNLRDLARLYGGLARGGLPIDLQVRAEVPEAVRHSHLQPVPSLSNRLLSPEAAWYVSDILAGTPPPRDADGRGIAYKTGTSYGYRDAWAVGFDGRHTVAVWLGRADGGATPGLTGITAAAPLLFDAFSRISQNRVRLPRAPDGILSVRSNADLPPPLKRFQSDERPVSVGGYISEPVRMLFPPAGSTLELPAATGKQAPVFVLKAEGGALPLTWLVNGQPLNSPPHRREVLWSPDGSGFANISVIDSAGHTDRVAVRVRALE